MKIQEQLFALQDTKYRDFNSRLLPTVAPETIIGVRVPALRKLAKELGKTPEAEAFLRELPHVYYEENCIHGFLIEQIRDFSQCVAALNVFLPYVDNWGTCDSMSPKALKKEPELLLEHIRRWLASGHTYTIRFGILCLMRHFLDENFRTDNLERVAAIRSEEYYVNMMIAWYFAEALAKQYGAALPYLQERKLAVWTHNKAIQKARESYRITAEQKEYLKSLKIKK